MCNASQWQRSVQSFGISMGVALLHLGHLSSPYQDSYAQQHHRKDGNGQENPSQSCKPFLSRKLRRRCCSGRRCGDGLRCWCRIRGGSRCSGGLGCGELSLTKGAVVDANKPWSKVSIVIRDHPVRAIERWFPCRCQEDAPKGAPVRSDDFSSLPAPGPKIAYAFG